VNSGVLLMNLAVWRRDYLADAVLTYIREKAPKFPDQTAICAVLANVIVLLAEDYNLMLGEINRRLLQWTDPRIIHWNGPLKPWLYRDAPFQAIYLYHRNQTPFSAVPPRGYLRHPLRRLINLIAGRKKYWFPLVTERRARPFTDAYLLKAGQPVPRS